MKKTILAIYGRANEGKSETIKNVCRLILDTFPTAVPSLEEINYEGDILLTITIGKVKIGIESQGDPKSRIIKEDTLRILADENSNNRLGGCNIIICATRTGGETVNKVDEIANSFNYNILWLSSFYSSSLNSKVLNRIAAENTLNIVKSLIVEQL